MATREDGLDGAARTRPVERATVAAARERQTREQLQDELVPPLTPSELQLLAEESPEPNASPLLRPGQVRSLFGDQAPLPTRRNEELEAEEEARLAYVPNFDFFAQYRLHRTWPTDFWPRKPKEEAAAAEPEAPPTDDDTDDDSTASGYEIVEEEIELRHTAVLSAHVGQPHPIMQPAGGERRDALATLSYGVVFDDDGGGWSAVMRSGLSEVGDNVTLSGTDDEEAMSVDDGDVRDERRDRSGER